MSAEVAEGTDVALLIAASAAPIAQEELSVIAGGEERPVQETSDPHGNRMHLVTALPAGPVEFRYRADGVGRSPEASLAADPSEAVVHLRASRYCEVDEFTRIAEEMIGPLEGRAAVRAVVEWVHSHLAYVPGSSTVTDSARTTYLSRQGVCRDYAHLTATVLRAGGIPARCAAVYAPGLAPMDFHLAVEALVEGRWIVVDATRLAPRSSMVRIATGQDAADTAFMTTLAGNVTLTGIQVGAVVDPALPQERWDETVVLR